MNLFIHKKIHWRIIIQNIVQFTTLRSITTTSENVIYVNKLIPYFYLMTLMRFLWRLMLKCQTFFTRLTDYNPTHCGNYVKVLLEIMRWVSHKYLGYTLLFVSRYKSRPCLRSSSCSNLPLTAPGLVASAPCWIPFLPTSATWLCHVVCRA